MYPVRPLASFRTPLSRVISRDPSEAHATIFGLDSAEKLGAGALLAGAAEVAGARDVAGGEVVATFELAGGIVGACGCPSTVSVTGA